MYLWPVTSNRAPEIAYQLLAIFSIFGAPRILQSDNGREFVNCIIEELCSMWEGLKIVHGKLRHRQSQGSVERVNSDNNVTIEFFDSLGRGTPFCSWLLYKYRSKMLSWREQNILKRISMGKKVINKLEKIIFKKWSRWKKLHEIYF